MQQLPEASTPTESETKLLQRLQSLPGLPALPSGRHAFRQALRILLHEGCDGALAITVAVVRMVERFVVSFRVSLDFFNVLLVYHAKQSTFIVFVVITIIIIITIIIFVKHNFCFIISRLFLFLSFCFYFILFYFNVP